jgi:AcrR family transcriptional regulator
VATQNDGQTRRRLLDAAADLFAERGIDGAPIDAIAERADRTSGAVYDHFGGKDGLLFACSRLGRRRVGRDRRELSMATTLDERLGVLWRNVSALVAATAIDRPRARLGDCANAAARPPRPSATAPWREARS